jgi:serine/threonine-protein kinase
VGVAVGQSIGNYEIEALAGRGSMAEVYRARRCDSGAVVAIKLIHPHLLNQPKQFERFRREAEVLKKIQHPHIARLYDFVIDNGAAYMVMEYLGGGTLESRLAEYAARREPVPLEQANAWMSVICGAVDYAHRSNLVHRDLKPANILFREEGAPVLTDFGLVYWIDQPRLSGTGSVTGTPAYISPEQARGQVGDRRSDVYSLGVILYEALTGQTPFTGNTLGVAIKHISELPPSPRVLGRYLPPGVEAVIMRALSKDPIERYQSAQLLADALQLAITRGSASNTAPLPSAERSARPAPLLTGGAPAVAVPRSPGAIDETPLDTGYSLPLPWPDPVKQWLIPLAALGLVVAAVAGVWWGASLFKGGPVQTAAAAARFSAGAAVRVVTTDPQASVSVLRGCPTGFWMGVLGVASAGDVGRVLERRTCDGQWWYRVNIPEAADAEWDGVGWIDETFLEVR